MGKNSKIEWTDHTWNCWFGCKEVSPGCKNCYAKRDMNRYGKDFYRVAKAKGFNKPLGWKEPAKVFVCSWSDFFIKDADPWRDEAWEIIRKQQHLTFQILTKRPERIEDCLPKDWGSGYFNVWIGITVENEKVAEQRIPYLLKLSAWNKFVSAEPLLGLINFYHSLLDIGWVIVGGESGPAGRVMDPDWARDIRDQCKEFNTPFFMKQMTGNTKAMREAIPDDLMIREFPNG